MPKDILPCLKAKCKEHDRKGVEPPASHVIEIDGHDSYKKIEILRSSKLKELKKRKINCNKTCADMKIV